MESATMETTQKRVGNILDLLVEFMEKHPKLIKGKFSADFTLKNAQKLWAEISLILNSVPGAKKEWKQWRKIC